MTRQFLFTNLVHLICPYSSTFRQKKCAISEIRGTPKKTSIFYKHTSLCKMYNFATILVCECGPSAKLFHTVFHKIVSQFSANCFAKLFHKFFHKWTTFAKLNCCKICNIKLTTKLTCFTVFSKLVHDPLYKQGWAKRFLPQKMFSSYHIM